MKRYDFTPNQIFNMDETGVQTVLNILPKHVAPTGKKELPKTVAAEQGQTVTAVCALSPEAVLFLLSSSTREKERIDF